jgi:uncharacterized protein (TIGR03089 family)
MGALAAPVPETVDRLFAAAVAADPTLPLLTWYDDATGERVELSGATLDNWVAKTANLLVDGCGLGAGDRATVLLPPHWQSAAVLLGCWIAGLSITLSPQPADVLFATGEAAEAQAAGIGAGDRYALGLAPLGAPMRAAPPGFADYIAEVRVQGDRFTPVRLVTPEDSATHGRTPRSHRDLCAGAAHRAGELALPHGARVLVDADTHPDPLDWLLAPLAVGGSVVLCGRPDRGALAGRAAAERVTVALTELRG